MSCARLLLAIALLATALPARAGQVEDAGADLDMAGARLSEVSGRRQSLQADLDAVAARIEVIKRKDDRSVLGDGSLESLLRRSQELAVRLSTAAREEDVARGERAHAAAHLVGLCDAELGTLGGAIGRREPRALARGAELSARRDHARSFLPSQVVVAPLARGAPTDDPRELRERADLLRDQRDRVMTRLAELDGRIAERRQQADLDRAMGSFLRQGALFDETRRVLSTATSTSPSAASPSVGADKVVTEPQSFGPQHVGTANQVGPQTPVSPAPAPAPVVVSVPAFGDARSPADGPQLLPGDASLPDLEAARAELLRQARSLEVEAASLEARARALGSGK